VGASRTAHRTPHTPPSALSIKTLKHKKLLNSQNATQKVQQQHSAQRTREHTQQDPAASTTKSHTRYASQLTTGGMLAHTRSTAHLCPSSVTPGSPALRLLLGRRRRGLREDDAAVGVALDGRLARDPAELARNVKSHEHRLMGRGMGGWVGLLAPLVVRAEVVAYMFSPPGVAAVRT
jgi:hypothetical protein